MWQAPCVPEPVCQSMMQILEDGLQSSTTVKPSPVRPTQATLHFPPTSVRHPAVGHPFLGTETAGTCGSAILIVSWRTAPKSYPLLELKAPGTFSQTIQRGRMSVPVLPLAASAHLISFIILICSIKSPDRSPARPARLPATDKSWQGLPPMMTLTGSTIEPLICVISPKCFNGEPPIFSQFPQTPSFPAAFCGTHTRC